MTRKGEMCDMHLSANLGVWCATATEQLQSFVTQLWKLTFSIASKISNCERPESIRLLQSRFGTNVSFNLMSWWECSWVEMLSKMQLLVINR